MTDEVVQRLVWWLADKEANPEISSNIAYVASGGPRFFLSLAPLDPDPHKVFLVANTHDAEQVDAVVQRMRQHLLDLFPEVRGEAKKMWMGASEAGLYEARLVGPNADVLMQAGEHLLTRFRELPGILSAKQDWENPVLKLAVEVDQARAKQSGLTSEAIAEALQSVLSGSGVTDYQEGELSIPVVTRAVASERGTLTALQAQSIYSSDLGDWIPLVQVADIRGEWQTSRIKRRDQSRTLTVSAKHAVLGAAGLHAHLLPALNSLELPPGYRWEVGGEVEKQGEAIQRLFANLPLVFGVIVLLLIWQFNSVRRMGIIVMTIPLILVGATLGLVVMQALFGFMVILGFFSLAGIIINNGIVLIDRIAQEEYAGKSRYEAIIDASVTRSPRCAQF